MSSKNAAEEAADQIIDAFLEFIGDTRAWHLTEGRNDGSTWFISWDRIEQAKAEFHAIRKQSDS